MEMKNGQRIEVRLNGDLTCEWLPGTVVEHKKGFMWVKLDSPTSPWTVTMDLIFKWRPLNDQQ